MSVSFKFRDPLPPPPDHTKGRIDASLRVAGTAGFALVWVTAWILVGAVFAFTQLARCAPIPESPDGLVTLFYLAFYGLVWIATIVVHAAMAIGMAVPVSLVRPRGTRWRILYLCVAPEVLIGLVTGLLALPTAIITLPLGVGLTFVTTLVLVPRFLHASAKTEIDASKSQTQNAITPSTSHTTPRSPSPASRSSR